MSGKNTYKVDRTEYSGAFFDTLTDPLFVVKQKYINEPGLSANARNNANSKWVQPKDEKIIAENSLTFFKPYKKGENFVYLVGYTLDIKGDLLNTTYFPLTNKDFGRIKKMIKGEDKNLLYFNEKMLNRQNLTQNLRNSQNSHENYFERF